MLRAIPVALLAALCARTASGQTPSAAPSSGGLGTLDLLTHAATRSISAENPAGGKGRGGMAIPNPGEAKRAASAAAADDLGQGWKVRPFLRVNAHQTAVLMDVKGPGEIEHFWISGALNRNLVLRIYWDGEKSPSVQSPLFEFFGVGHGKFAPIRSLAVVDNPTNAMNCFWPMPFRKHALITLENEGDTDVDLVAYQITYEAEPVPANAAYFHAEWRHGFTGDQNPYVILDNVRGAGRYVGTFLAWSHFSTGWFGEGEVKFYIDGDKQFPTICGTGTEDYFMGSYGFPQAFSSPYSGSVLPATTDRAPSFWSLYRWHIRDPINFADDLKVTIQALGWGSNGKYAKLADKLESVAYWYQTEPHTPFQPMPSTSARLADESPP
ncbi:MAG: DUF2961 domain-containing protein [Armatimonadetes bacterium]|nr:DUF2961 domain-containing protein [Armatimonadota bacterium]MDE2206978.1 DUF2961 domain-containing protein [Armatimonadota bacterium]